MYYVVKWDFFIVSKDKELLQSEIKTCSNIICLPDNRHCVSSECNSSCFELFCVNCFVFIFIEGVVYPRFQIEDTDLG